MAYDATGNRTMTGYTTGDNNRLLDDGTHDYEYDDEGNRTKKTNSTTGDYEEFGWDHRNRLISVTFRNSQDAKTKEVLYTYDVYNRLILREVDDDGDEDIDRAESFVYDGSNVVLVFDITSAWQHRYLHGDAVDQVFLQENVGEILWGLADNQGTIRDVANYDPIEDESAVLNHRKFDAYGNITAESNSSIEFRYAYTGRYFDEDTGLQYNRARWYDATVGRWISEDPIGFQAGDTNIARYAWNSPTNFTDPNGMDPPGGPPGESDDKEIKGAPPPPGFTRAEKDARKGTDAQWAARGRRNHPANAGCAGRAVTSSSFRTLRRPLTRRNDSWASCFW